MAFITDLKKSCFSLGEIIKKKRTIQNIHKTKSLSVHPDKQNNLRVAK